MAKIDDFESLIHEADELYDFLISGRGTFESSEIVECYRDLIYTYTQVIECSTAASFDELIELIDVVTKVIRKLVKLLKEIYRDELSGEYKPFVPIYKHVRGIAVCLYDPNLCEELPDFVGEGRSIIDLQNIQIWCKKASKGKTCSSNRAVKAECLPRKSKQEQVEQERRFVPWKDKGDARFVVEDNRIKFYYNGQLHSINIKYHSHAHKLLKWLNDYSEITSAQIKGHLNIKYKAYHAVRNINNALNHKLQQLNIELPDNIEFIAFDNKDEYYFSLLPI